MPYCIYLRKSRADIEAEMRGEEETLARHEDILLNLARRQKLKVESVYREILSGETIAARPVMQQLLSEVEQGSWTGVLVVEVERLARGDTVDQGIVARTFKYSGTKIITPAKTYDPDNEFDEEYFEFGLFMSRREYKTINRRLQSGRVSSIREGKYVGNRPPYGYSRKKIEGGKGWTLAPEPDQADGVRAIYDLYVHHNLGPGLIAKELDRLGFKPARSPCWSEQSIRDILANPVYAGYLRWKGRPKVKRMLEGELVTSRPRNADAVIAKGIHDPIIGRTLWEEAQAIREGRKLPRNPSAYPLMNPLAGIVKCGVCGKTMIRRPHKKGPSMLICGNPGCPNVGSQLSIVEDTVIRTLSQWFSGLDLQGCVDFTAVPPEDDRMRKSLERARVELGLISRQLDSLHDLLEQGVYSADVFLARSQKLADREMDIQVRIQDLERQIEEKRREAKPEIPMPRIETILDAYYSIANPGIRNRLLKSIVKTISYTKATRCGRTGNKGGFILDIHPLAYCR